MSFVPSYRVLCLLSAGIAAFLAASYLFFPSYVIALFGVPQSATGSMMSGRAAMLFCALGLIYWFTRDITHVPTQIAVCKSSALAMGALLLFGIWQMVRGFAGPGHLFATAAEALYLLLFVAVWMRQRQLIHTNRATPPANGNPG